MSVSHGLFFTCFTSDIDCFLCWESALECEELQRFLHRTIPNEAEFDNRREQIRALSAEEMHIGICVGTWRTDRWRNLIGGGLLVMGARGWGGVD